MAKPGRAPQTRSSESCLGSPDFALDEAYPYLRESCILQQSLHRELQSKALLLQEASDCYCVFQCTNRKKPLDLLGTTV
jgi:hypothetical protein